MIGALYSHFAIRTSCPVVSLSRLNSKYTRVPSRGETRPSFPGSPNQGLVFASIRHNGTTGCFPDGLSIRRCLCWLDCERLSSGHRSSGFQALASQGVMLRLVGTPHSLVSRLHGSDPPTRWEHRISATALQLHSSRVLPGSQVAGHTPAGLGRLSGVVALGCYTRNVGKARRTN